MRGRRRRPTVSHFSTDAGMHDFLRGQLAGPCQHCDRVAAVAERLVVEGGPDGGVLVEFWCAECVCRRATFAPVSSEYGQELRRWAEQLGGLGGEAPQ